jgi:hypothetical protein
VIIYRRRRLMSSLSLILIGFFLVPFVVNGGVGTWVIIGGVWLVIVGVLLRRFRNRGNQDDTPPWAVEVSKRDR